MKEFYIDHIHLAVVHEIANCEKSNYGNYLEPGYTKTLREILMAIEAREEVLFKIRRGNF